MYHRFNMSALKERIVELRSQGLTYNEIVAEVGCSKGTVAYYCGDGQKEKNLSRGMNSRWQRQRKVDEIKNVPCADCKKRFPSVCMDFDHVQGDKIGNVSTLIITASWEAVMAEIAKCEVVCANCHRIRTRERGGSGWTISV